LTPAARLAAAAAVLDQIAASRAAAEQVLQAWGRANRYAGSGDRRAIAERVFQCLRARARLSAAGGAENGRTLVLFSLALLDGLPLAEVERLYGGGGYGPAPLTDEERARLQAEPAAHARSLPPFVEADFRARFGANWEAEAEALTAARAPVDLRVNGGAREGVTEELRAAGLSPESTPFSAWGIRLPAGSDVKALPVYAAGRVEIQDEGSQLAAWLAAAQPGERVVDYCAGGGGKALALAQMLSAKPGSHPPLSSRSKRSEEPAPRRTEPHLAGSEEPHAAPGSRTALRTSGMTGADPAASLIACDVDPRRLEAIRPRLERAGVAAELRQLGPEGQGLEDLEGRADLVFVDAPCSGSGTWRRRPEALWRLTEVEVERLHALQVAILAQAARLVRPGGRLVYVTCSVLGRENEDSAAAFAASHRDFRPVAVAEAAAGAPGLTEAGRARLSELAGRGHQLQLTPARTGTDGFFLALFAKSA
jgi:16S rRNA (cytosine967-C5)-methyltransferase